MKIKLNTNNSKKLIIEISILFCAVILIVGGTLAFFTESDTKEIGNLVTENINGTLHYDDNNDYMFGNLIPVSEEDVLKFASKDTDICKYQEGMYACNLYEFTITNNSNVAQELMITLKPTSNEFGNLHYILLDKNKDNISLDSVPISNGHINEINSKEIANNIILGPGSSKTYTIVYYVKNFEDIDQTSIDAGKQFYAKVRVDSITTGTYAGTLMESRCYEYEEITEGDYAATYKLTKFNGIDESGNTDESCGVIKDSDTGLYSITVPSKIKDEDGNELEISTLGNQLFSGLEAEIDEGIISNFILNDYTKITNIEIEEGIKVLEDGNLDTLTGTFVGIGVENWNINNGTYSWYDNVTVSIPSTLEKIGEISFSYSAVEKINYNKNKEGNTNLVSIGAYSFISLNLNSLTIPKSVEIIGEAAFTSSPITNLFFEGTNDGTSQLKTIGDYAFDGCNITTNKNNPLIIPYSVNYIGDSAFSWNHNLTKLSFAGSPTLITDDNQLTIGDRAFYGDALTYLTEDDPLILSTRISYIGDSAFRGDSDHSILDTLKYIRYMGSRDRLNNLGTNWYHSGVTLKAYGEE